MNRAFAKAHGIANRFRALAGKRPLFAKKGDDRGELYIYETIGADWWTGGGITGKSVKDALAEMKGVKSLDIFINSEGGDVFEAKAIYTNLLRFDAEKVVHVDGIAASAATFIAMAGDKIITSPVATWMVHEAWSMAMGRAADMRAMADLLDLENRTIAETYAKQTEGTVDEMLALMDAETWMNAQTALDKGFTDEIAEDDTGDDEEAEPSTSKTSALIAAAAATQERIRSVSPASLLVARAEMRRRDTTTRSDPAKPGTQRPASR